MITKELIISEYENVLLGINANRAFRALFNGTPTENQRQGGIIWRYAIENLLHWTPIQAELYLTKEMIQKLKLDKTLVYMGIEFGPRHYFSIKKVLQIAFPEQVTYSVAEEAVSEYMRINKLGQWKGNKDLQRYHRSFFKDEIGHDRSVAIVDYVISTYFGDMTMSQIYKFFGGPKARKWVREHGLQLLSPFESSNTLDFLYYMSSYQSKMLYFNEKIRAKIRDKMGKPAIRRKK